MKTNVAIVNDINDTYQFEELELREIQADEVIVKIVASGICQSDEGMRKSPLVPKPLVLGHEGAGIVEEVGAGVKGFEEGDQVVMSYGYCGTCDNCRSGQPSACIRYNDLNLSGGAREDGSYKFYKSDGTPVNNFMNQSSFSTYTITTPESLIKVDSDADLRKIAPLGCGLMTGFGAVTAALKPETSSSIAVFGTGAVGLGALMTALIEGCSEVIAIDIVDSRLELAESLGATHTINSATENLQDRINQITNGRGVNYSIDTTGVKSVMKSAVQILALKGETVPLAITENTLELEPTPDLILKRTLIHGVNLGNVIPQLAVRQLTEYHKKGIFPFEKLIKYYKFDGINQAASDSSDGNAIKPILVIDKEYRKDDPIKYTY